MVKVLVHFAVETQMVCVCDCRIEHLDPDEISGDSAASVTVLSCR